MRPALPRGSPEMDGRDAGRGGRVGLHPRALDAMAGDLEPPTSQVLPVEVKVGHLSRKLIY